MRVPIRAARAIRALASRRRGFRGIRARLYKGGRMHRVPIVVATAVSTALLVCGVAVADTVTTTFDDPLFALGSVNGQHGWKSAPPRDDSVVQPDRRALRPRGRGQRP